MNSDYFPKDLLSDDDMVLYSDDEIGKESYKIIFEKEYQKKDK